MADYGLTMKDIITCLVAFKDDIVVLRVMKLVSRVTFQVFGSVSQEIINPFGIRMNKNDGLKRNVRLRSH